MTLKRYWFIIYPEDRYGQGNFGVTAQSAELARQLLINELHRFEWGTQPEKINEAEIIEDIDIRMLDAGHVKPNMGIVTFKGVWFPNFSLR